MIRQGKVTDLHDRRESRRRYFNLVAHNHYERVPNYRNLSDAEEVALRERA